jgi:hypothetical protein
MKFFYLRSLAVLIGAVSIVYDSSAQASQFIRFLQAGTADGSKLTRAYLNPVIESLSYGVNGGWHHTARPHQRLGFDVSLSATAVFLPSSAQSFRADELGLENTVLLNPSGIAPTMIGSDVNTTYQSAIETPGGTELVEYAGAEGLDFPDRWLVQGVAVPMFQAGVGIGKNTDLKLRFIPTLNLGSVTRAGLVGLGFMHDIKQHIPAWRTKTFDLSLFAGYTRMSGEINTSTMGFNRPDNDLRQQEMPFKVHAFLVQGLISKQLTTVTFYGGIGYNAVRSRADVLGSYVTFSDGGDNQVVLTDPFSLSFRNNSMRVSAGARLNIGDFYLHGDYTLQEYSTISLGLGYTRH